MNKKYLWILALSILLGILFYSLLFSSFTVDIEFTPQEELKVEEKADQKLPSTLPKFIQNRLAYQNYSKTDFLLGVIYNFNLQIEEDILETNRIPSFEFSLTLPGKVIMSNASRVEGNKIIWQEIPQDHFFAQSYTIRWWLVLAAIVGGYLKFKKKKAGSSD